MTPNSQTISGYAVRYNSSLILDQMSAHTTTWLKGDKRFTRGRKSLSAPPSLRTVQADFPHTALRSVFLPARGLNAHQQNHEGTWLCLASGYRSRSPQFLKLSTVGWVQRVTLYTQAGVARCIPELVSSCEHWPPFSCRLLPSSPPSCLPSLHARYGASLLLWTLYLPATSVLREKPSMNAEFFFAGSP